MCASLRYWRLSVLCTVYPNLAHTNCTPSIKFHISGREPYLQLCHLARQIKILEYLPNFNEFARAKEKGPSAATNSSTHVAPAPNGHGTEAFHEPYSQLSLQRWLKREALPSCRKTCPKSCCTKDFYTSINAIDRGGSLLVSGPQPWAT